MLCVRYQLLRVICTLNALNTILEPVNLFEMRYGALNYISVLNYFLFYVLNVCFFSYHPPPDPPAAFRKTSTRYVRGGRRAFKKRKET